MFLTYMINPWRCKMIDEKRGTKQRLRSKQSALNMHARFTISRDNILHRDLRNFPEFYLIDDASGVFKIFISCYHVEGSKK